jgi:hypothetical protein
MVKLVELFLDTDVDTSLLISRQQQQREQQQDDEDNDEEDEFCCGKIWLAKSGNNKTDGTYSYSSTLSIPKKLAVKYRLNRACSVIMVGVEEGVLIKRIKI